MSWQMVKNLMVSKFQADCSGNWIAYVGSQWKVPGIKVACPHSPLPPDLLSPVYSSLRFTIAR